MYEFPPGSAGKSLQIFLRDSSTGQAKTGLVAAGGTAGYVRENEAGASFALAALAGPSAPYSAGGFAEISAANNPGMYRVDVPDAAWALGANYASVSLRFPGALDEGVLVLLRQSSNTVGPGGTTWTVALQTAAAVPIAGAGVWVSTDPGGGNVVAGALYTNALGTAVFLLNDGDYYLWVNAPGYSPLNPYSIAVNGAGGGTFVLAEATAPPSFASAASHTPRVTAHDLVQRLLDYGGADRDVKNARATKVAVTDALREFATSHEWSYLRTFGRTTVVGPYSAGTVEYLASAGTYPRQLTLTGGVWPGWAMFGYVRVGGIVAKVEARISDTVLTLKDPCYAEDRGTGGTGFILYRDTYTLPADFVASDHALAETCWGALRYIRHTEWLGLVRHVESIGTPTWWTIGGDPDVPGRLAMKVYPAPHENGTLDYVYHRKPREVSVFDLTTGTASAEAADPTLITLSAPVLKPAMKGSVIRLAAAAGEPPDSIEGSEPYAFEGNIVSVLSATQLRTDAPVDADFWAVAYRISDPIDAEDLQQLLMGRAAEKHFALSRILKTKADAHSAWRDALVLAKEGDTRVTGRQSSGQSFARPLLLREKGRIDFSRVTPEGNNRPPGPYPAVDVPEGTSPAGRTPWPLHATGVRRRRRRKTPTTPAARSAGGTPARPRAGWG